MTKLYLLMFFSVVFGCSSNNSVQQKEFSQSTSAVEISDSIPEVIQIDDKYDISEPMIKQIRTSIDTVLDDDWLGNQLINYCNKANYKYLLNKLKKLKSNKSFERTEFSFRCSLSINDNGTITMGGPLLRELTPGIYEQIIEVEMSVEDSVNNAIHSSYNYRVYLVRKGDDLLYHKIIKEKRITNTNGWETAELVLHTDSSSNLSFLYSSYEKYYSQKLDLKELFDESLTYGEVCGFASYLPLPRRYMNVAVRDMDLTFITDWLRSPCAEKQVYAVSAVFELKSKGLVANNEIDKLIELISQKEGFIQTCSGCMHMSLPIKEVIYSIKANYNKT